MIDPRLSAEQSATGQQSSEGTSSEKKLEGSLWRDGLHRLDQKWVVLLILFGVMGALGLPILWYSGAFRHREKMWLSVAAVLYTIALVALAATSVWMAWHEWRELLR